MYISFNALYWLPIERISSNRTLPGPMGLGRIVERYVKDPQNVNSSVVVLPSAVIGNNEDSPNGAVHRRKHRWSRS